MTGDTTLHLEGRGLEELVSALASGVPVKLTKDSPPFSLVGEDSRTLFAFYVKRRDLWPRAKPVQGKEIEELLIALASPPVAINTASTSTIKLEPKFWKLTRIEIHRFGGLHRHCGPAGQTPETLVLDLDRDITFINGFNGAGKTALQSAIMWCLTGRALRSQHMPDEIHEPMEVQRTQDADDDQGAIPAMFSIPPIVPIPTAEDLVALSDKPKIDTWVQLTFQEEAGTAIKIVKRSLLAGARGAITAPVTGLTELGLPSLAIESGTLMPAVASHMRFDEKTTFASAIAQLTGLKPLEDLGRRAVRLVKRVSNDETDKSTKQRTEKLLQFLKQTQALRDAWEQRPDLGVPMPLHTPEETSPEKDCSAAIQAAKMYLEKLKDDGLSDVQAVLGETLKIETQREEEKLLTQLSDAREALSSAALSALPSLSLIKNAALITLEHREAANKLMESFAQRAVQVADRARNKSQAARWQLYVQVAAWHKQHHPDLNLSNCPVCASDLDEVPLDALLVSSVKDALQESLKASSDAAKGVADWSKDAAREFLDALPACLRTFADQPATASLFDLYKTAYVDELFQQAPFEVTLRPLHRNAEKVWKLAVEEQKLPDEQPTISVTLPKEFLTSLLWKRFANVQAAMHLAVRREECQDVTKGVLGRYVGTAESSKERKYRGPDSAVAPMRDQLAILRHNLESSAPILSLLRQLDELEAKRQEWAALDARLVALSRIALAAQEFVRFPDLVHAQVSGLIQGLDTSTRRWMERLYKPHYVGGPSYRGIDPLEEKGVGLRAGFGEMMIPAHQVMNSSQLRACVWAFLFSLWERIREKSGGIDAFLLDDPQTHFDPINCENLAAAIPSMVTIGMHPIITSNDNRFIASIRDNLPRKSTDVPSWSALYINPISSSRLTACLSPSVEEVYERRDEWRLDENDAPKAQRFVERVRLHVENRLWDLLASDPAYVHKPTLADLLGALSGARTRGEKPFNEVPFERLLSNKALKSTAPFYVNINKAHHHLRDMTPHEASEVSEVFDEIDKLIRSCSATYARFMGRLTREDEELLYVAPIALPPPAKIPLKEIQILGNLSARTSGDSLAIKSSDSIYLNSLGDVALFGIRGSSLGTLALPGQIVVASLSQKPLTGDPVIAQTNGKTYARRFHADGANPSRVTLACDLSGSENVAPALALDRGKTSLLPIVGVLYDHLGSAGQGEAYEVSECQILNRELLAARIVDDSAYPVIRSGDTVLLEELPSFSSDKLQMMKGEMVAILAELGETFAYLKRVGDEVMPGIRLFENIGVNGNSLPVRVLGSFESEYDLPRLQKIWLVHGVLRSKP